MKFRTQVAAATASLLAGVALVAGGGGPAAAQVAPTPASYINPDTGAPTENADVDPASECETPDQADTQTVGDEATGAGNVHNDACLFDAQGIDVDAQVAFEASGVGVISACPDPDGAGPKTATLSPDRQLCVQSGFETGGTNGPVGDGEYHARLVSATAGTQTVDFCADPEGNGCADADAVDTIVITWEAAAGPTTTTTATTTAPTATSAVPRGGVQTGVAPTGADGVPLVPLTIALGMLVVSGALVVKARATT
jgi:hypothetical protein